MIVMMMAPHSSPPHGDVKHILVTDSSIQGSLGAAPYYRLSHKKLFLTPVVSTPDYLGASLGNDWTQLKHPRHRRVRILAVSRCIAGGPAMELTLARWTGPAIVSVVISNS